jgi:hypothetical protein
MKRKPCRMSSNGLQQDGHDHLPRLVRGCCAHVVFVAINPNVIQINHGRPLHVSAKQHHKNEEALICDITFVHLRSLDVPK